jgi:hypothetical protein
VGIQQKLLQNKTYKHLIGPMNFSFGSTAAPTTSGSGFSFGGGGSSSAPTLGSSSTTGFGQQQTTEQISPNTPFSKFPESLKNEVLQFE